MLRLLLQQFLGVSIVQVASGALKSFWRLVRYAMWQFTSSSGMSVVELQDKRTFCQMEAWCTSVKLLLSMYSSYNRWQGIALEQKKVAY